MTEFAEEAPATQRTPDLFVPCPSCDGHGDARCDTCEGRGTCEATAAHRETPRSMRLQ